MTVVQLRRSRAFDQLLRARGLVGGVSLTVPLLRRLDWQMVFTLTDRGR